MRLFAVCFTLAAALAMTPSLHPADTGIVGVWYTLAEDGPNRGRALSHIEIYEKSGRYYGRITKLLVQPKDLKCTRCTGDRKDQPVNGMVILWEMIGGALEGGIRKYEGGRILDVNNGKDYQCQMSIYNDNKIKVRYYYFPLFYRTEWWYRHSR